MNEEEIIVLNDVRDYIRVTKMCADYYGECGVDIDPMDCISSSKGKKFKNQSEVLKYLAKGKPLVSAITILDDIPVFPGHTLMRVWDRHEVLILGRVYAKILLRDLDGKQYYDSIESIGVHYEWSQNFMAM